MSFQKRLFFAYSLLIIILVLIVGLVIYKYSLHNMESNAISKIDALSDKLIEDIDSVIYPMNFIIDYLISNSDMISSVITLSSLDRTNIENHVYINEATQTIRGILYNYLVSKNFYRVSFFNRKGDFLTSNFLAPTITQFEISKIPWVSIANKSFGKNVLLPKHKDFWGTKDNADIFSIVRTLQGAEKGLGFIEVQKKWEEISSILSQDSYENIKMLAVTDRGDIFFNKNIKNNEIPFYFNLFNQKKNQNYNILKNPFTKRQEYIFIKGSKTSFLRIIFAQDKTILQKPIVIARNTIILFGFIIVFISLIYIYIFSIQFTNPIRRLKKQMDKIEIYNLSKEIKLNNTNDEIKALNNAFQRLLDRLNEAINRELKYKMLQIKANMEALQAQINPHFIYNILNVLSHRGVINNDEETIEICNNLASMLRYSTSTTKNSATIKEELEHVKHYLLLMKKRFEDKLQFNIDIKDEILDNEIPKITLQPIVENAFNHGFNKKSQTMQMEIRGYTKDNWWFIEIIDNGDGFEKEKLERLKADMSNIRSKIITGDNNAEFEIGGMGLLNTYTRLLIYFNDNFVFSIDSNNNGTIVKLGAKNIKGEGKLDA